MKPKNAVDSATPVLTEPTDTIDEKVDATNVHYNAAKASSDWTQLPPALQVSFATWLQTATSMGANKTAIDDLVKQTTALRVAENVLVVSWLAQKQVCVGGVRQYCAGAAAKVKNLGFGVLGRVVRPPAPAPTDLKSRRSKVPGVATLLWTCDAYRHTYQVQFATDAANPATYSALMTSTKRSFQLTGQTPGATLHFRVVVLEAKLPGGQTAWSPWFAVTVS